MSRTTRLFIALPPPRSAAADLRRAIAPLHLHRSCGDVDRWHVTIAFIGDVAESVVDDAVESMRTAVAGLAPFPLRLAGGGRFGRGRYSVVWAGVDGDVDALVDLATRTRAALSRAGLPVDRRPYRPHLTLARTGDKLTHDQSASDLMSLRAYRGPEWSVDGMTLYASDLGPPVVHRKLAVIRFPSPR